MSSREIKFRAWDNVDYMSNSFTLEDILLRKIEFTSEAKIMQFTGLKDKNGKEIYEGDILSAQRTVVGLPTPDGKAAEVFGPIEVEKRTWNEIIFAEILVTENSIGFTLPKEGGTYQERGKPLQWEIIGNIYQNPELLQLPTTENK